VIGPKYRTFWPRFWAGAIDGCVFLPIVLLHFLVYRDGVPIWLRALWYVAASLSYPSYVVVMHARYGQTLGKMLTHVKVLDISETALSWKQALLREAVPIALQLADIACMVPAIAGGWSPRRPEGPQPPAFASWLQFGASFGWFLAELVTMLTNEKRRAVHDFIAGSVVVRVTKPALSTQPPMNSLRRNQR